MITNVHIFSYTKYIYPQSSQYLKHIRKNVDSFVQKDYRCIIYYLACVSIIYYNIYYNIYYKKLFHA